MLSNISRYEVSSELKVSFKLHSLQQIHNKENYYFRLTTIVTSFFQPKKQHKLIFSAQ